MPASFSVPRNSFGLTKHSNHFTQMLPKTCRAIWTLVCSSVMRPTSLKCFKRQSRTKTTTNCTTQKRISMRLHEIVYKSNWIINRNCSRISMVPQSTWSCNITMRPVNILRKMSSPKRRQVFCMATDRAKFCWTIWRIMLLAHSSIKNVNFASKINWNRSRVLKKCQLSYWACSSRKRRHFWKNILIRFGHWIIPEINCICSFIIMWVGKVKNIFRNI